MAWIAAVAVVGAATPSVNEAVPIGTTLREAGPSGAEFVGYVRPATLPAETLPGWPGLQVRRLSADPSTGRLALQVDVPAHWRLRRAPSSAGSIEFVMLEGRLRLGRETLERFDFGFVPPGARMPALSSEAPARALLFFDPPAADASAVERQRRRGVYVTHFAADRWQPASLAKSAGATADLRIQHLKKDPFTSARTWYIRLGAGASMPWEVHSMVEEGYLMAGHYRLAECLPTRTVIGDYAAGDYFWRPGGIAHGGPQSGPADEVIWLQRTQVGLDVRFFGECVGGAVSQPVAP